MKTVDKSDNNLEPGSGTKKGLMALYLTVLSQDPPRIEN